MVQSLQSMPGAACIAAAPGSRRMVQTRVVLSLAYELVVEVSKGGGRKGVDLAEHLQGQGTDLPLGCRFAADREKMTQRTEIHSDNDARGGGIRQDEPGILFSHAQLAQPVISVGHLVDELVPDGESLGVLGH
jgi:hypothetical protein